MRARDLILAILAMADAPLRVPELHERLLGMPLTRWQRFKWAFFGNGWMYPLMRTLEDEGWVARRLQPSAFRDGLYLTAWKRTGKKLA